MKKAMRIVSVIILLTAMGAGAYLVQQNQESRKGAAAAETSMSVLPYESKIKSRNNFSVTVWVNTGSQNDKLVGSEFELVYDHTKLEYVSTVVNNNYQVLNEIRPENGKIAYKMITMGEDLSGAVNVLKVTFRPLRAVAGTISVNQGKVMISGQSALWDVGKYVPGRFVATGEITTTPPRKPSVVPTKMPTRVPTVALKCGSRCQTMSDCGGGMVCAPSWWTCKTLPSSMAIKLSSGVPIDPATMKVVLTLCPDLKNQLPATYKSDVAYKFPAFQGVCRNVACVNDSDCVCKTTPSPMPTKKITVTPVRRPTLSIPKCVPITCKPGEVRYCPSGFDCGNGCSYQCGVPDNGSNLMDQVL